MPWFTVDDSFYDNPKVRRAGNAAAGLWLRCGTYSARYLLDGRIPADIAATFGRRAELERLVDAGLMTLDAGEYVIHDYLEHNPSASEVKQRRTADRERKRQARENGHRAVDHDPTSGRFVRRST